MPDSACRTRITDETVAATCRRARQGERVADLAAELRVSPWTVYMWLRGARRGAGRKKYKYLTDARVYDFRVRAAQGELLTRLCREFGLSRNAGDKLVSGKRRPEAGGPLRHQWQSSVRRVSPREDFWSAEEDELAMTVQAKVAAVRTGRTEAAVWARKRRIRAALRRQLLPDGRSSEE
jgi:hypothetical protein